MKIGVFIKAVRRCAFGKFKVSGFRFKVLVLRGCVWDYL
jgi:hypothetical protein